MKIYINRLERDQYPNWKRRIHNGLLQHLHGINIDVEGKDVYVEPVYIPLVRIIREAGQTIFDWHFWREHCITWIFMLVPPYLWRGRSESITLEDAEND